MIEQPSGKRCKTGIVAGVVVLGAVTLVGFLAFGSGSQPAASSPAEENTARTAVDKLKSKDFETRQAAATELRNLGAAARPYSAQIETALKDAIWEGATFLIVELDRQKADSTFTEVSSHIGPPTAEERKNQEEKQRKLEERRRERDRQERESRAKAEQWKRYIVTLLQTLERADPERFQTINARVMLEALTAPPLSTSTFKSVGTTVSPGN
jgi:hypothetical protein